MQSAEQARSCGRRTTHRRLAAPRASGHRDPDGRAAAELPRWPCIRAMVHELAGLARQDRREGEGAREHPQGASERLCKIGRLGRPARLRVITCTRPGAETVSGQLKANLADAVAVRIRSRVSSQTLVRHNSAIRHSKRQGTVPVTPCPQSARARAPLNYVDDSTLATRAKGPSGWL